MTAPLVVVKDAFRARGKGVLLEPRITIPTSEVVRGAFPVRLRLPDGTERPAIAELEVSHLQGHGSVFGMVRLPELAPEDVPAGTVVTREASSEGAKGSGP